MYKIKNRSGEIMRPKKSKRTVAYLNLLDRKSPDVIDLLYDFPGKRKPRPKGLAAYEMGDPLGSGGFGEVFAARRKKDNLPVSNDKPLVYTFYRVALNDGNYS